MRNIHIQHRAKHDLKQIWRLSFTKWGERQANTYYDDLTRGMEAIANNPHIGLAREHLGPGYRQYQVRHHLVFYRLTSTTIKIIRVLSEKMDIPQILKEQP